MEIEVLVQPCLSWSSKATVITDESGVGSLHMVNQNGFVRSLKVTFLAGMHIWGLLTGFLVAVLVV